MTNVNAYIFIHIYCFYFCIFPFASQSPPTSPTASPAISSSAYQEQARRFYSSDRPPISLKSPSPLSPGRRSDPSSSLTYRTSAGRNQDNCGSDSRRPHNSGSTSLLSTWNGGGSSVSVDGGNSLVVPLLSSSSAHTPSAGGAASMPSSPRLGRRSGTQEPAATSRTRKYSAGSLSGMMGGCHSRSLPRLCPSPSPRETNNGGLALSTLPPRRSDGAGGYKLSKDFYNNNNYQNEGPDFNHNSSGSSDQNQPSTQREGVVSICLSSPKNFSSSNLSVSPPVTPPDVTISSRSGGSPRVAKKLSLTSTNSMSSSPPEVDQRDSRGLSPGAELYLGDGEKRGAELNGAPGLEPAEGTASLGKTGQGPLVGLGERRQSFGKAGVTPPGGFRERRGSISSLSGKEELTDYHQRQKEERLREQEVERLVSSILQKRILTKKINFNSMRGCWHINAFKMLQVQIKQR